MEEKVITPIIYPSAAEFWRGRLPSQLGYTFNCTRMSDLPSDFHVSRNEVNIASQILGLPLPLSLYGGSSSNTHTGEIYITRRQKSSFSPGSFIKLPSTNIYIASPELTFLHAARYLNIPSLIRLGFDLCAQYYTDNTAEFGQSNRVAVSTSEKLIAYANENKNSYGCAKAACAASYVLDLSNSPMESNLAIILELPIKMGGYGLGGIEMNGSIELSTLGKALTKLREIRGDLVWREKRLTVEYNSKAVHNNAASFYNDSNRSAALKDSGWKCIAVTPDNIKTFADMENIAGVIRKQLGLHTRKDTLASHAAQRQAVYNELFN